MVGYQEERGGLEAPRQAEQLLPQPTCRLVLSLHLMKLPESPQRREESGCLADVPAELQRPGVGCFDFQGCKALGSHQHRAEHDLHIQLLLGPLWGLWEGAE